MKKFSVQQRWVLGFLAILSLAWLVRMRQESYSIQDRPGLIQGADFILYWKTFSNVIQGQIPGINFFVEYPPYAPIGWLAGPVVGRAHSPYDYLRFLYYQNAGLALFLFVVSGWILIRKGFDQKSNVTAIATMFFSMYFIRYFIVSRYDIFPATVLTLSLLAYQCRPRSETEEPKLSFAALVGYFFSVALKIYPILFAPAIFTKEMIRRQSKSFYGAIALIAAMHIPFVLLGSKYIIQFLQYHSQRNIEIESSWAYVGLLFNLNGGSLVQNYGSYNFDLGIYRIFAKLSMPIILALCFSVWVFVKKSKVDVRPNLGYVCVLLLSIFVLFGKVWSPQYMIWFVALLPLLRGRLSTQIATSLLITAATYAANYLVVNKFPEGIIEKQPIFLMFGAVKILSMTACSVLCFLELKYQSKSTSAESLP